MMICLPMFVQIGSGSIVSFEFAVVRVYMYRMHDVGNLDDTQFVPHF